MPAMPANPQLYARIRAEVYKEMPTHSAYRSATLVRRYKESGGMYQGKKPTEGEGLRRWLKEDWRNQRGGVGYQKKGDVYRPTRRVNAQTPITFGELTAAEVRKAQAEKANKGRVKTFRPTSSPTTSSRAPSSARQG